MATVTTQRSHREASTCIRVAPWIPSPPIEPVPYEGETSPTPAFAPPRWSRHLSSRRVFRSVILVTTDASTLAISGFLSCAAGFLVGKPLSHAYQYFSFIPVFLLGYAFGELYTAPGLGATEALRRLTLRTSFVLALMAASVFALRPTSPPSRVAMLLFYLLALSLVPMGRFALLRIAKRFDWWGEPAVVVGSQEDAQRIKELARHAAFFGYTPVAVCAPPEIVNAGGNSPWKVYAMADAPLLARAGARVALVFGEDNRSSSDVLTFLQRYFHDVIVMQDLGNNPVEGTRIRNIGGFLGVEYRNQLLRQRNRMVKRAIDLVCGFAGLILSAPVVALAALSIRMLDPGPAFYFQDREGEGGRIIRVPKVRTMFCDAQARLERLLTTDLNARKEWESRFKLANDPRVLPWVGRLFRRLSIDELPQFWSVVKGDLSLVGPRPFPLYHLEELPVPFRMLRRRVRPGLTGLWQVMVRGDGDLEDQRRFDTYYIRNWSIWLDVYILAKTVHTVLWGRGAH